MTRKQLEQKQQEDVEDALAKQIIKKEIKNGVQTIIFNRSKRANSFTNAMYFLIAKYLNQASEDPNIKCIIIRGKGKHFSSGNDLGNFADLNDPVKTDAKTLQKVAEFSTEVLRNFTTAFVNCKKPIIVCAKGGSVGVAFTLQGLCDICYATTTAKFMAPLVKLAQGPEMISAYTFPKIFGRQKAFEIITLGKVYTAQEMHQYKFVNQLFEKEADMISHAEKTAEQIAELDSESVLAAKRLILAGDAEQVKMVMEEELKNLTIRWQQKDALMNSIAKHMSQKPKL